MKVKHVVSFYNVIIQGPDIKQIGECVDCQSVKIDFMNFFAGVFSLALTLLSNYIATLIDYLNYLTFFYKPFIKITLIAISI